MNLLLSEVLEMVANNAANRKRTEKSSFEGKADYTIEEIVVDTEDLINALIEEGNVSIYEIGAIENSLEEIKQEKYDDGFEKGYEYGLEKGGSNN